MIFDINNARFFFSCINFALLNSNLLEQLALVRSRNT